MKQLGTIEQTMSSREIAELTNKRHHDVMRDIRNVEVAYIQVYGTESKFALSEYRDGSGRMVPEYQLDKSQTLFLVSGYNPVLRAKIQKRWEELEANDQNEDLVILKSIEILQGRIAEQQLALTEAQPKIEFANAVATTSGILVRQFAKLLIDQGFNIGQNRLYAWLRENGYLNHNNEPYQSTMNMGLFETTETVIGTGRGSFVRITPKITGKGQLHFTEKLKNSSEFNLGIKLF